VSSVSGQNVAEFHIKPLVDAVRHSFTHRAIDARLFSGAREWRGVASDGVTAAYVGEATVATDASPTLVQPAIITYQWRVFVPFSIELGQDWPELQGELVRLASDARDVNDATQFLTGNATNSPGGILNIGGTGGLTTTQRVQTAVSVPLTRNGVRHRDPVLRVLSSRSASHTVSYRMRLRARPPEIRWRAR